MQNREDKTTIKPYELDSSHFILRGLTSNLSVMGFDIADRNAADAKDRITFKEVLYLFDNSLLKDYLPHVRKDIVLLEKIYKDRFGDERKISPGNTDLLNYYAVAKELYKAIDSTIKLQYTKNFSYFEEKVSTGEIVIFSSELVLSFMLTLLVRLGSFPAPTQMLCGGLAVFSFLDGLSFGCHHLGQYITKNIIKETNHFIKKMTGQIDHSDVSYDISHTEEQKHYNPARNYYELAIKIVKNPDILKNERFLQSSLTELKKDPIIKKHIENGEFIQYLLDTIPVLHTQSFDQTYALSLKTHLKRFGDITKEHCAIHAAFNPLLESPKSPALTESHISRRP
jgi:hypothetical protein